MSKPKITIPLDKLELYDKLIAGNSNIERKGKTMPYTSVNGHMFSFLDKNGVMGLRLSMKDYEAFQDKYKTGPNIQYEKVMREYVVIPNELLMNFELLSTYLQKSFDYVSSLKPKSTKKK
jgi:hypothetical protein